MAADTEKLLQENAADQIGAGHALLTGHSWSQKCVSCSTLKEKNPSRDALLSICLAIGTELEEAQYLLKYAGQAPLYVRRKRDVVIWFGFMKHMSLDEVDEKLIKRGYKPLLKGT